MLTVCGYLNALQMAEFAVAPVASYCEHNGVDWTYAASGFHRLGEGSHHPHRLDLGPFVGRPRLWTRLGFPSWNEYDANPKVLEEKY